MTTYALNGLGRIGKLALKPLLDRGAEIAWINDAVGDPEMHAHLLEFDTVHGRWQADFAHDRDSVTIDGTRLPFVGTRDIGALPLEGVDVVIDCTGVFKTEAALAPYFAAGVKKVVVSAPVKDGPTANIVYGVNDGTYDPAAHDIVTAASCTTNCLAPVVKVIHETFGIRHGAITTIHDVTNTQTIVDRPAKDLRRARSALNSLIPTTTGSATAITLIYPSSRGDSTVTPCGSRCSTPRSPTACSRSPAKPPPKRSTPPSRPPPTARSPASSVTRPGRWYRRITPTTPAPRSSTRPRPWSWTARR